MKKLQNDTVYELTDLEKASMRSLLKLFTPPPPQPQQSVSVRFISMEYLLAKLRNVENTKKYYIECGFIFGSIAEVKRVWGVVKHILLDDRTCLTPQLFESLEILWSATSYLCCKKYHQFLSRTF